MLDKAFNKFLQAVSKGNVPAWLQKGLWRGWYTLLARRWKDDNWTFMNYGWLPEDPSQTFELQPEDEVDRYFIGLYYHLACLVNPQDKQVLEVGSGRGGGASYIARYHKPCRIVGLDYSDAAVALSRRLHANTPNLSFKQGDAEQMPFDDQSFDMILNVESSHCYGNMPAFVAEVARVLKPGGKLAWVDLRGKNMIADTDDAFNHPELTLVHSEEITPGVVRALDSAQDRKAESISTLKVGAGLFKQFAAMPGSTLYNSLNNGQAKYLCRVYQRH